MTDAIRELKIRAEILHKKIKRGDGHARGRLRVLAPLRRASDEVIAEAASRIRRQDCLTVIAVELGFANWPQAKQTLRGDGPASDFGTLLYPAACAGHINQWFASYEEAAAARELSGGYLLAYRRQYLVVDRYFIESLGLDPEDAAWEAIGFDWVRPKSVAARTRLYAKLLAPAR